MKSFQYAFLFSILFIFVSCIKNDDNKLEVTAGYWGNLKTLNTLPDSRIFLINIRKNQVYRICLPKYFVEKYEGIEEEVKAAVHIWGHYIGRDIKLKIDIVDLPSSDNVSEDKIGELYAPLCPKSDLIIGESYLSGNTIGQTSYTYKTNKQGSVVNSTRVLLLKRSEVEGDINWISLSQYLKKPMKEADILEFIKSRSKIFYVKDESTYITQLTLMHELGHVWGLCDQYELGVGKTNCDGENSSLNEEGHIVLDTDSTMSKQSWKHKLFLTDDDIEGIRHLANRDGFIHGYPKGDEISKIEIAKIPDQEIIPVLDLNSVTISGEDVKFDFSLVTNVPVKIEYRYFEKNSKEPVVDFDQTLLKPVQRRSHKFTGSFKTNRQVHWDRFEISFQEMNEDEELKGYPFIIEYKVPVEKNKVP